MDRCAVGIIKSETSKNLGHLSNVFAHVTPEERTVSGTSTVSQLNTIAPDVYIPLQIVKVYFSCKVDIGTCIAYPSVVDHLRLLRVIQHLKVRLHKRIFYADFVLAKL